MPNSDSPEIAILQGFEVVTMTIRIDSKVLQCAQKLIHIISHAKLTVAPFITVLKPSFDNKIIKLLLLLKKHALPSNSFCDWLQGFDTNNSVDIILGNSNENIRYLKSCLDMTNL